MKAAVVSPEYGVEYASEEVSGEAGTGGEAGEGDPWSDYLESC